jgi:prevent-host-death family protein
MKGVASPVDGNYVSAHMSNTVNISAARANLSKLVESAAVGEEIIIAKSGKPKAKLVPYEAPPRKKRIGGQNLLGITYMADDWDGPLPPEIQQYFDDESNDSTQSVDDSR